MTSTDFDFDTLKSGLQRLEARLATHDRLAWQRERERSIARLQWGLWPLWLGQALQMLFGLACIVLGVAVWTATRDGSAIFLSGVIVHVYGVTCIALGGITLGMLGRVDRSAALLETQLRLAKLRRVYILGGMVVGLSWWLFWMPFMASLFFWLSGGQADLYTNLGGTTVAIMVGVGVLGLIGSGWFHRWSRSPRRPRLAKAMDDAVTGHNIARAQRRLDALRAFQRED